MGGKRNMLEFQAAVHGHRIFHYERWDMDCCHSRLRCLGLWWVEDSMKLNVILASTSSEANAILQSASTKEALL